MSSTVPDKTAVLPAVSREPLRTESAAKGRVNGHAGYLRHLEKLYASKLGPWTRAAHFVFVGSTGLVVDLAVFSLLLMVWPLGASRVVAIGVAMTWNFWLNRQLTFFDQRHHGVLKQYVLFCVSCLLGALLNWSVSVGLCSAFAFFDGWKQLAAICGVVAGTGSNYLLSCRVVFRGKTPDRSCRNAGPSPE